MAKWGIHEVMDLCLSAGALMLKSGAETYRVEDTMARMARGFKLSNEHVYVTPTAIIFSASMDDDINEETKFIRIHDRTNDLHKVALVNEISRQIIYGKLTLTEVKKELKAIEESPLTFPKWLQIIAAAFVSACFTLMFDGTWNDFIPSFVAGGCGYAVSIIFGQYVDVKFFSEMLAAFVIAIVAKIAILINAGDQLDKIIIGAVMPLVPGVLITNAVRDLMAGHLVSGLSRGAEALLTATAIGAGVAAVISWF